MKAFWLLTKRAIRDAIRVPEATIPTLFIPMFFLLINRGSLGDQFQGQDFLFGQDYAAFTLPISLLFATTGGGAGFGIVTEIENGYFDKLLAAPITRTSILLGRMAADFARNIVSATLVLAAGLALGAEIRSGVIGAIVLVLVCSLFGVAWSGFGVAIALKSKNAATVNVSTFVFFPLLFVAPNAVPRENMQGWLETAAKFNPVTYLIEGVRALTLQGWQLQELMYSAIVTAVMLAGMLALCLRILRRYNT